MLAARRSYRVMRIGRHRIYEFISLFLVVAHRRVIFELPVIVDDFAGVRQASRRHDARMKMREPGAGAQKVSFGANACREASRDMMAYRA